jgi:hypothetical protein
MSVTTFGEFRSPQHKGEHSRKISNLYSPQRTPIILAAYASESTVSTVKPTDKVIKRILEGNHNKAEGKKIAESVLQTHT